MGEGVGQSSMGGGWQCASPTQATGREPHANLEPEASARAAHHPSCPAASPGRHSQVCEVIQGLVRSEYVQQPNHLGAQVELRVQRRTRAGAPPRVAQPSGQETPSAAVVMPHCPKGLALPTGSVAQPWHTYPQTRYFWMVTAGIFWGKGNPESGLALNRPKGSCHLALSPLFSPAKQTHTQGRDSAVRRGQASAGEAQVDSTMTRQTWSPQHPWLGRWTVDRSCDNCCLSILG